MENLTRANYRDRLNEIVTSGDYYNCWGFTAAIEGWSNTVKWVEIGDMENYLAKNSHSVNFSQLRFGDILVYRSGEEYTDEDDDYIENNELLHTAVYINKDRIAHKPGSLPFEFTTFEDIENTYPEYGYLAEIRRANRVTH